MISSPIAHCTQLRGGEEKKALFFPKMMYYAAAPTEELPSMQQEESTQGRCNANDYVWAQLSNIFAYSQTNLQPILHDDRSNQDMLWHRCKRPMGE